MCVGAYVCARACVADVHRLSRCHGITQARMTQGAGGTNPRASTLHRPPLGECVDVCNWRHMATLVQQEREKHSANNSSISVQIPRASSTLFTSSDVDGSSGALSSLQCGLLAQDMITNVLSVLTADDAGLPSCRLISQDGELARAQVRAWVRSGLSDSDESDADKSGPGFAPIAPTASRSPRR